MRHVYCFVGLFCLVYEVGRVVRIPLNDQFVAGLANVLAVAYRASKCIRDIHAIGERSICAILKVEVAIQPNVECPGSQSFDLDSASGARELNDFVAQFLDAIIQCSFHETRCA